MQRSPASAESSDTQPVEAVRSAPTRVGCAGVPITAYDLPGAAEELVRLGLNAEGADVHLCNAYTLALADREQGYREMLRAASMNLADGTPLVWANQWRHRTLQLPPHRVRGTDLFLETVARGEASDLHHYLLGGSPETLGALTNSLRARCSDIRLAGAESPPYRPLTQTELDQERRRISDSGAHVVWVGLGTPKQDWHAAWLAERLPVTAVAVGAAFDFIAGSKREAPAWMRRSGLEWTYRLGCEPGRLWKRYLFGNTRFLVAACRSGGDKCA